ncbi:hypothetical protein AVEN_243721-1 [Araneus ventricosus]|uniref:Uncharacterized protein n=1 Tax=Araneus ventricosus TaxID=182803 RepID=A0A4Y2A5C2_ARAVE|nr:hypothetical protein AVEN_243721-1 [Araneus ventricosus]
MEPYFTGISKKTYKAISWISGTLIKLIVRRHNNNGPSLHMSCHSYIDFLPGLQTYPSPFRNKIQDSSAYDIQKKKKKLWEGEGHPHTEKEKDDRKKLFPVCRIASVPSGVITLEVAIKVYVAILVSSSTASTYSWNSGKDLFTNIELLEARKTQCFSSEETQPATFKTFLAFLSLEKSSTDVRLFMYVLGITFLCILSRCS